MPMKEWLQFVASWHPVPVYVALGVGLPSAVLYTLEVAVILRHRQARFSTSSYRLFVVRALTDLLGYVFSFLSHRFPLLGLFYAVYVRLPSVLLGFCKFVGFWSLVAQNIATAAISLNRFTAIFIPAKHDTLWHQCFPWTVALIVLIPVPFNIQMVWLRWLPVYNVENNTATTFAIENAQNQQQLLLEGSEQQGVGTASAAASVISAALFTLFSAALNVATLALFQCHRFQAQQGTVLAELGNHLQYGDGGGGQGSVAHPRDQQHQQREENGSQTDGVRRRSQWLNRLITNHNRMQKNLTAYAFWTFAGHFVHVTFLVFMALWERGIFGASETQQQESVHLLFSSLCPLVTDLCTIVLPAWLLVWASSDIRKLIFGRLIRAWRKLMRKFHSSASIQPVDAIVVQQHAAEEDR